MNSTSDEIPDDKMQSVFFPQLLTKINEIGTGGIQFAYYTTADVAVSILRNRQFWMRSATTMNDFMEIEHGLDCLVKSRESGALGVFQTALNGAFPGLYEELSLQFDSWVPGIRSETYLTSLSAHSPSDQQGRLSMWRAYGGRTGVALVIDGTVVLSQQTAVGLFASPVMYLTADDFAAQFQKTSSRMLAERDYLVSLGRDCLKRIAFTMLRTAAVCTKDPAFHEEKEWRVLAAPTMYPSSMLIQSVESVRGTPQIVIKVDLKDDPENGVVGLSLPKLLDRVIIGPCEFPGSIARALQQLMIDAGVPNPEQRISISGIPLRHM